MKSILLLLISILVFGSSALAQSEPKATSTLVWADEFDGTGIPNTANWDRPEYNRRNNENGPDGWWSKEDSYLDGNGNLIIRLRKIDNKNADTDPYDYSVGAVRTKDKFEKKYGKFEMRAKLPTQPGWWVAFWMMQGNVGSVLNEGVDGSEVDIMEAWGWNDKVNHAIHWDGYGDAHKSIGEKVEVEGLSDGYHIYTMEWYPTKYVFYIDGKETWRTEGGGICDRAGYVKITGEISTESWAIGDNWSRNPEDAVLPDSFIIDYVRVYELPEGRQTFHEFPAAIPGRIEAEDYDLGENGDAYYDNTEDNSGNIYRVGDVDVQECPEGGYNVGWITAGEWLEYTTNVAGTGAYDLEIRSASPTAGGAFQIEMNKEAVSGITELPLSASWENYQTSTLENVILEAGEQIMRLSFMEGNLNLNYLEFKQKDIVFTLDGIKKKMSYDFNLPIEIAIHASSIEGDIASIGLYLGNDSIGGSIDSTFSMSFTPGISHAGWNVFTVKIIDMAGNSYQHPIDVFFGNQAPHIEFSGQQNDTLITGEENAISVNVSDIDGSVNSIQVLLNEYEFSYENYSGILTFETDTLSAGNYTLLVTAIDNSGNTATDTLRFTMMLPPNILPVVDIILPEDGSVLYSGGGNSVSVYAYDADGYIEFLDVLVDGESILENKSEDYIYSIDDLATGTHTISALLIDNRGGSARDSIEVIVTDSLVSIGEWTLYTRNGALASVSEDQNTVNVCVERATGDLSDVQLMREMPYIILKGDLIYNARFFAQSTKITSIVLVLKDEQFEEDTVCSRSYGLTTVRDSLVFTDIPETDYYNFLSFYLGYRKSVCISIGDFEIDFLDAVKTSGLANVEFVFPNPVKDRIFFKERSDYKLYSASGKLVMQGMKCESIDMGLLGNGLYLLRTEFGPVKVLKN